jgi:WD40 repeat protein
LNGWGWLVAGGFLQQAKAAILHRHTGRKCSYIREIDAHAHLARRQNMALVPALVLIAVLAGTIYYYTTYLPALRKAKEDADEEEIRAMARARSGNGGGRAGKKKRKKAKGKPQPKRQNRTTGAKTSLHKAGSRFAPPAGHRLLAHQLKGSRAELTDCAPSADGRWIVTASRDGGLRVYSTKELAEKTPRMHHVTAGVIGAHFSAAALNDDGTALVAALTDAGRSLRFYSVPPLGRKLKGGDGALAKPEHAEGHDIRSEHAADVDGLVFATGQKRPVVVSCTRDETDSAVRFWSKRGARLAEKRPGTVRNLGLAASGCSNFFALPSWSSELRIFETLRGAKTGAVEKVALGATLRGHGASVVSVAFGHFPATTLTVATGCRDGRLRVFDAAHPYLPGKMDPSPKLVQSIDFGEVVQPGAVPVAVALSPDGKTLAAAVGGAADGDGGDADDGPEPALFLFRSAGPHKLDPQFEMVDEIERPHGDGRIAKLAFVSGADGSPLLLSFSRRSKSACLWRAGA